MKKSSIFIIALFVTLGIGLISVPTARAATTTALTNSQAADAALDESGLDAAGPLIAPADPNYISLKAATQMLMEDDMSDMPGMSGMSGMSNTSNMSKTTKSSSASSSKSVSAAATLDPATYGQWTKLGYPTQVRSIHVSLLRTGKVLLVAGSGNIFNDSLKADVWDPATGNMKSVPPPYDMFCGGHVALPNGDILIVGGTRLYSSANNGKWSGSPKAYKFDVTNEKWVALPSMHDGRWYPTAIMNGAGDVDVYGGHDVNGANSTTPERYSVANNTWTQLPKRTMPMYAGLVLTAKGTYYYTGAKYGALAVNPGLFGVNGAKQLVNGVTSQDQRRHATSLLVGDANNQLTWLAGGGFPAITSTRFTDLKAKTPVAVAGPNLKTAKAYVSAVDLPNLNVLETGGGTAANTPVYEASVLDPITRTLTSVAPPTVGRTYHSSAILMPDATIATFGGDPTTKGINFEMAIEIYKPAYMFKGTRPTISAGPTEVSYGSSYDFAASASNATLSSAVLARPMSTTHSTDANQRTVKLTATVSATGMNVTIPANHNIAPPGWYMLFVNDSLGRPSVAKWVHIS